MVLRGVAEELDELGQLIVRDANAVRHRLTGGEVGIVQEDL